jgi:hypothetical protein
MMFMLHAVQYFSEKMLAHLQDCFPFSISHLHLLRGLHVQFYNEFGADVLHVPYLPLLVATVS